MGCTADFVFDEGRRFSGVNLGFMVASRKARSATQRPGGTRPNNQRRGAFAAALR